MSRPLWHSSEEIAIRLADIDVLSVVRDAFVQRHAGMTSLPQESCLYWEAPDGGSARSIAMHGYLGGDEPRVGIKVINSAPRNIARGTPRADGLIALFDPLSARVTDILEAAEISATRTAAVSVLAAQHLASKDAGTLAILGAGALGAKHLRLFSRASMGIKRSYIFDVDTARANSLVRANTGTGIGVKAARTARQAVESADIVIAVTTATKPYIPFSWIKRGSLVVSVSLEDLHDDLFINADAIYVDDLDTVLTDKRRRLGVLCREGVIATSPSQRGTPRAAVTGQLDALFAAAVPGREHDRQIIIVNPFGLAISDVALATTVACHDT